MIQHVEHSTTGVGAADLALALEVVGALHAPTAPHRTSLSRPRNMRR